MPREYVGKYELRAHFDICARCREADLATTRGAGDLCITGAQLLKSYAQQSRQEIRAATRAPKRRAP